MKKLIFAVITLLLIVVLAVWGDRILSRALDAELGALLSKELGLPVKLAPIKATILTLKASSAKLVMGDPNDPAVVATEVIVTLAWSDLLKREIRLVRASAKDLMVAPSLWPSSNDPWPEDYKFLEPYLPKKLQFDSGRYINGEGSSYPVKQFSWQRKFQGGATADWSEDRAEQTLTIGAAVTSLDALLRLAPIELDVTIGVTDQPLSNIQLKAHLQPADTSGYILDSTIQAAGMNAQLTARNTQNWRLPNRSEVTIDTLEPDKLMNFFQSYSDSARASEPEAMLASALPQLSLPQHQGHVSIDKIQWGNEVGKDSAFDFTTGEQGIKISSLTSKGPSATLQGQIDLATAQDGWALKVTADLQARDPNDSIAGHYINANWFWRAGHTQLDGKGGTWGGLLNAMKGEINLSGAHRGKIETPVKMAARLGRLPGEFTLEELKIELGEGHITGSASLSGTTQRELKVDLKADQLNLDFLYADESGEALPGMAVPEYLDFLAGVEISWKLLVTGLQAPGISLSEADITLQREPGQGYLTVIAQGVSGGDLHLQLDAHALDDGETDVSLAAKLSKLDIPQLFQQELLVKSRATGTINFAGSGPSIQKIFQALSGKAELTVDLRRDNNWQRASVAEEELRFSSNATLEIKDDRILGVKFSELDIDSIAQDVTGTLSLVDQRTPWLIADLQSDNLNLDGLLDFIPPSTEQTEQNDLLSTLKDLGEMRISLNAKSLTLMDLPLSNMQLEVSSIKNVFSVDKLDFTAEDSQLSSRGDIRWSGRKAGFKASVNVTDFDLDRFLIADLNATHVPVSGSAELASEGHKLTELLANLTGQINLRASQQQTTPSIKARRNLIMTVKRLPDGLHADINTFELGSNELSGSVRYHKTSPPQLDIEIVDGTLSIVPWQDSNARQQQKPPTKDDTGTAISGAARASANFVGNMVLAPARFFSGPAEAAPGEKYLSSDPLPLDKLKSSNAKINGKLASITSNEGVIKDLTFSGTLDHGKLSLQAKTGYINQGSGELEATLDTNVMPPSAQLTVSFSELKGAPDAKTYPSSGFTYLASQGQSPAELAANLNGTMYLKLGKGPIDYQRFTLLNADVASSMFRTLIPGLDKKEPEIQCGVTLITFKDGMGITPYGFAARTNSANLIGRLAIDLKKEMMELQFDSRSREGVGISVGSVFSNTVQVKGPLTDPEIVPNTTSIIWRGAAAFMTAGLSVVGESVFKRALASSNPCKAINKDIRKDICKTSLPAASSPLVCPTSPAG